MVAGYKTCFNCKHARIVELVTRDLLCDITLTYIDPYDPYSTCSKWEEDIEEEESDDKVY